MYDQLAQEYFNTHSLVSQHALADYCEEVGDPRADEWRLRAWLHEKFIFMTSKKVAHYGGQIPTTNLWIDLDRNHHHGDATFMRIRMMREGRYVDIGIEYLSLDGDARLIEVSTWEIPMMFGSQPSLYPPWKNADTAYRHIARINSLDF